MLLTQHCYFYKHILENVSHNYPPKYLCDFHIGSKHQTGNFYRFEKPSNLNLDIRFNILYCH